AATSSTGMKKSGNFSFTFHADATGAASLGADVGPAGACGGGAATLGGFQPAPAVYSNSIPTTSTPPSDVRFMLGFIRTSAQQDRVADLQGRVKTADPASLACSAGSRAIRRPRMAPGACRAA